MQFIPTGDSAVIVSSAIANELSLELPGHAPDWIVDQQMAFGKLTIIYNANRVPAEASLVYSFICDWIKNFSRSIKQAKQKSLEQSLITIPVIYGGPDAPDLPRISKWTRLSIEKIIKIHSTTEYHVAAVGFMPGFGYLTGLPRKLQTPRHDTPRLQVPAGAVGIGGTFTGVYPFASPGGWNLIGKTKLKMFDHSAPDQSIFKSGMRVRFTVEKIL